MRCTIALLPIWTFYGGHSLALAYLKSALEAEGIACRVFNYARQWPFSDERFYIPSADEGVEREGLLDSWVRELLETGPDVLAFSVVNANIEFTQSVVGRIRKMAPGLPIVCGGPAIVPGRLNSVEKILEFADFAVEGEGEEVFPDLVRRICRRESTSSVPQLWFKDATGKARFTRPGALVPLDQKPFPNFDDFSFDPETDSLSMMFSRGCVLKCTFCNSKQYDTAQRSRTADSVFRELLQNSRKYGARRFEFVDDSLISRITIKELEKFCDLVIAEGLSLPWFTNGTRIEKLLTPELARKLHQAGMSDVTFGVESFSSKVQHDMGKSSDFALTDRCIRMFADAGIRVRIHLIYGYPSETDADFEETRSWLSQHGQILQQIGCQVFSPTAVYFERRPRTVFFYGDKPYLWLSQSSTLESRRTRFLQMVQVAEEIRSKQPSFIYGVSEPCIQRAFHRWSSREAALLQRQWAEIDQGNDRQVAVAMSAEVATRLQPDPCRL